MKNVFAWLLFLGFTTSVEANGSATFLALPRMFAEDDYGKEAGFSKVSKIPEFALRVGAYRFRPARFFVLEPLIGFSFLTNSGGNLERGGSSQKNKYSLLTGSVGLRILGWEREFFPLTPFVQSEFTTSWGRYTNRTDGAERKKSGTEMGSRFGGGLLFSFLSVDQTLESDMEGNWELQDFGLELVVMQSQAGWFQTSSWKDMDSTSSLLFGGGLYVSW